MRADLTATVAGVVVDIDGALRLNTGADVLDRIFTSRSPADTVAAAFDQGTSCGAPSDDEVLAPIGHQEIWAAGVTYLRSRTARVSESREQGGDHFYDLVYDAERPELFFKATPHRVVGHGGAVRIRGDSTWNVPEPEFTLAINSFGSIFGYTIGNDMSSRSIEGENPLYLPQAKLYSGSASIGPRLVITDSLPSGETAIRMQIVRAGVVAFEGETALSQIQRPFESLVDWLYRDNSFPAGAFLMTGTGIVPGDDFTLAPGDDIRIEIDGIGTLVNHVAL
jgi:2-dehydro-3-deoxy-D-arabinonate dehydratase